MFINPMWDHESERIGKQRCTPLGYLLHGISDLIGFLALLSLMGVIAYLLYLAATSGFTARRLLLLTGPLLIAAAGNALHSYSWWLADRRRFKYDREKCISTWIDEEGVAQSYQYGRNPQESDSRS